MSTPTTSGPAGLVTLIVGDVGRSGSRSRARSSASQARTAKQGTQAGGPRHPEDSKTVSQWSCRWSSDGPGPLLTGCDEEADLTLTIGTDDAYRVKTGELGPSVAFMQGKLKSTGDNALLLSILSWSATAAFAKALTDWAAERPT